MNIAKYKLYLKINEKYNLNYSISNPIEIQNFCNKFLKINQEPEEVLYVLGMNNKKEIISIFEISRGIVNSTLTSPREIFKRLIISNCSAFAIVHNHFGSTEPSKQDIDIYNNLKKCSEIIGIGFVDSLILYENNYYSFFEMGVN